MTLPADIEALVQEGWGRTFTRSERTKLMRHARELARQIDESEGGPYEALDLAELVLVLTKHLAPKEV